MSLEMEYYHVHSNYSNLFTQTDSTMFISDYAKEYRKRGNHVLCISEHGNRSNVWEQFDICQKYKKENYDMIPLAAAEAYFTDDRHKTDGPMFHLILVSKNMDGFYQLNECLSEANISGFYRHARVDFELLEKLNTNNFMCTTACVAGVLGHELYDYYVCRLHDIFKDNLRLEIQHHQFDIQKKINERALMMYKKYNIPLIYGTDSHYITHEDRFLRKELMKSANITHEYEDDFDLYLPTAEEGYKMLLQQNIFSKAQIEEAIENTLILRDFEGVTFDNSRKMPNCKPDMTVEQRNHLFKKLVAKGYIDQEGGMSEQERLELKSEVDTITETNSADYFILHKEIIDKGKEYGGKITQTSRGSAASFATNYALGFTTINRLKAPVTLYPDRFISKDRLAAGSNPDIDLNMANVEAFEKAGKDILGEYGCLPMVAYGTTKTLSAFKLLARARDLDAQIANDISNRIKQYEEDIKRAKENNSDDPDYNVDDDINIVDYIDNEDYLKIIKDSYIYLGIKVSISPHPCAHLLLDKDIRREIGVISLKPRKGSTDRNITAYIDGATADGLGYLKADFLRVDVVKVISDAFEMANEPIISSSKLMEYISSNDGIWELYENGFTIGLNQCEKEKSTAKCMRYKPHNIVELASFVAGIRPGFKSQVETFLSRTKFSFGIKALDDILQTPSRPDSFIEFDEDIMHIAQYAGISGSDSYKLIKAVKKKIPEKVKHYKEELESGFYNKMLEQGMTENKAKKNAEDIWNIVEGSASYLFNMSHALSMALDSCYGAYLKLNYPYEFYTSMLKLYDEKGNKDKIVSIINEMKRYKGITLLSGKLGQDNTQWVIDRENKTISQSLSTVRFISKVCAQELSRIKDIKFDTFTDCLFYLSRNTTVDKRQRNVLIGIGYFDQFGSVNKLSFIAKEFDEGQYKIPKNLKSYDKRLPILRKLELEYEDNKSDSMSKINKEFEDIGLCLTTDDNAPSNLYYVQSIDDKYSVKLLLYSVKRGTVGKMKLKKNQYNEDIFAQGDFITIDEWSKRNKYSYLGGKRTMTNEKEFWIDKYKIIKQGA